MRHIYQLHHLYQMSHVTCENALTDARKRRMSRRRRREDGGRAGRDERVFRHLQRADHHGRRVVISLKVETKKN